MSGRAPSAARGLLWITLLATVPLPYFMVEIGWMPVIWLAGVGSFVTGSALLDGFSGTWLIALLFIAQALAYAGILYLASVLVVRASRLLPAGGRTPGLIVLIALLWGTALFQRIFRTDLVNVDPHLSLLELF